MAGDHPRDRHQQGLAPAVRRAHLQAHARDVTRFMESLRRMRLAKVPGVAETLDWAQALATLHADHLDEALVSETIGAVLKDADDIKRFRAEIAKSGLGPLLATP